MGMFLLGFVGAVAVNLTVDGDTGDCTFESSSTSNLPKANQ